MKFGVALRLGRVSNLPTVWTNSLAAVLLAGGNPLDARMAPLLLSMTLFYVGGMYLNDAFDAAIDARERSERPIPTGQVSRAAVFVCGFLMLAFGVALLAWIGYRFHGGGAPLLAGIGLAGAIVLYNVWHKNNPLSPLFMGLCRLLVYVGAALCFVLPPPGAVWLGALLLLCYLIGLTYIAKQENLQRVENLWPLLFLAAPAVYGLAAAATGAPGLSLAFWLLFVGWVLYALYFLRRRQPGDIPRAVVSLIAGMCLFDALLIVAAGAEPAWALLAVGGFVLTLAAQRLVPVT